ncbi:hypothetical protein GWO13_05725, partial [Candidatus Bathyarchaeota archaeon]|nr:hypothetical protein [Candidatus Bathyarchaeota archaeon]
MTATARFRSATVLNHKIVSYSLWTTAMNRTLVLAFAINIGTIAMSATSPLSGQTHDTVEANGINIYYEMSGSGPYL